MEIRVSEIVLRGLETVRSRQFEPESPQSGTGEEVIVLGC